jgi:DNA-binding MarR family transcriptional regulator
MPRDASGLEDPKLQNERNRYSVPSTEQQLIRHFAGEIGSISVYLEEIYKIWASALGLSCPQFKILMALSKADGVGVNILAKMLHVEPSFVTTQSKALEKKGLLYRKPSSLDKRVVHLSLSDMTHQKLGNLAEQQMALDKFIFKDIAVEERSNFIAMLALLKVRIEKARHRAALECLAAVLPSRSF